MNGWKGYLGGVGMIITGIYLVIDGKVGEGVAAISAGIGLIGIRDKQRRG